MSSGKWRPFCLGLNVLTHSGLNKLANICRLSTAMKEISRIFINISLKISPKDPIDNKSTLVQVMTWCQTSSKLLPNPVKTQPYIFITKPETLQRCHNESDGISNHWHLSCLLSCLFGRRSKRASKLRVTGLCVRRSHRWPMNFPHKGPGTWKTFPFDDVVMKSLWFGDLHQLITKHKDDKWDKQFLFFTKYQK